LENNMKSALIALAALVCLSIATPAHAWNCSDPLASRVDVGGTKPAGASAGDGDGQYYIGGDAANSSDYYVCEVPKTPTTPTGGNSNANSSSSSNSSAASNSASTSSATGGKATSNSSANGGSATASGGNATGGNSSSGVTNSGNSSVNNTNNVHASGGQGGAGGVATATGGNQKQQQSQTLSNAGNSTASASGNGVGNGNNANDTTINEQRDVASAYAPSMTATVQCFKPFSGGGQGLLFGASFGGGKIDDNCARLEASRQAPSILARCKVYLTSKYAKEAHVTIDDCLPKPVVVIASTPVAVVAPVQPSITINVPPAIVTVIPAPVVAPAPSVAVAAAAMHHRTHVPCNPVPQGKGKCVVDNNSIKQ
jgi:hypothetical protein